MKTDTREAWDRLAGAAVEARATNYMRELILSRGAGLGVLTAVSLGAILSIPFGVGIGFIPLVGYLGSGALAALFVPDSPLFRYWVDRRKRFERREGVRAGLLARITELTDESRGELVVDRALSNEIKRLFQTHDRMRGRIATLLGGGTSLSIPDIDELDEATVDFLRLFHARLLIRQRMGEGPAEVEQQLHEIEVQLDRSESGVDTRRLEQARASLEKIARARSRLPAREVALKAQLTTLAELFEDLYQRVTTDPAAGGGEFIAEAVAKLSIEEELAFSVEEELEELTRRRVTPRGREVVPAEGGRDDLLLDDPDEGNSRSAAARAARAASTSRQGERP